MVERITYFIKSGKETRVIVYGLTSKTPDMASAKDVLKDNRGHWSIENSFITLLTGTMMETAAESQKAMALGI